MKVVYKYRATERTQMAGGAKILKVAFQDDVLCVWAEVEDALPRPPNELRCFVTMATGERFNDEGLTFLETVFIGPFVFHIYERAL